MAKPTKPRRIFVIDDNPVQLLLLTRALGRIPNTEVLSFQHGTNVFDEYVSGRDCDLLVATLDTRDLDGWRLCRLLRSPEFVRDRRIPILLCTSTFAGEYVHRLVLEAGADDFVQAPFDPETIRQHAVSLLDTGKPPDPRPVVVAAGGPGKRLSGAFEAAGFRFASVRTPAEVMEALGRGSVEVVVIPANLVSEDPAGFVRELRLVAPAAALVLLAENSDPQTTISWLYRGADDVIARDAKPEAVVAAARAAAQIRSVLQIEDRRRKLDTSRRRHEKLFDEMPDGCVFLDFILDDHGRLVDCRIADFNAAFTRILDVTDRNAVRLTLRELLPESAGALVELLSGVTSEHGVSIEGELHLREIDRHLEVRAFALSETAGVAVFTDRTGQYREAQARRSSEQRFRTLIEAMNEGMLVIDGRGLITYANESMARMLESKVDALQGGKLDDFLDQPGSFAEILEKVSESDSAAPVFEAVWRRARGGGRIVTVVSLRRLPENQGWERAGAWLALVADVSDLARAQRKAEALEKQLHQAQKMEAVGRLAGGVAHDFNNFLTVVINAAASALGSLPENHEASREIRLIRETARSAAGITRQLLIFSRKSEWNPKPADLNTLVQLHIRLGRRIVGEDIEFQANLDPEPVPVLVDAGLMSQVLLNFSVNARDAMPQGGTIFIQTRRAHLETGDFAAFFGVESPRPGDYAVLSFRDTGCGIPSEHQTRIFEPFFTTKDQESGTGLGLATVFGIVQRHNGFLALDSKPGQGAEFIVYLPLLSQKELDLADSSGGGELPGAHGMAPRGGQGVTVLLVEDQPLVRRVTQRMLERLGFRVLCAPGGEEALQLVEQPGNQISLLMTDVIMKGMDGVRLARRVHQRRPDVAILFTSGYPGDWLRQRGIRELKAEFLNKPYSEKELVAGIRAALKSRKSE